MARVSNLKIRNSELKEYCLLNMYDEEKKKKVSIREFMRTKWASIGGACKSVGSIQRWMYEFDEIVNAEPMKGQPVTEENVYIYNVEIGRIDPSELSYDDFTKDTRKIKNKLDKKTLIRANEMAVFGFTQNEMFSLARRRDTLVLSVGEARYNEINEINKKKTTKEVR